MPMTQDTLEPSTKLPADHGAFLPVLIGGRVEPANFKHLLKVRGSGLDKFNGRGSRVPGRGIRTSNSQPIPKPVPLNPQSRNRDRNGFRESLFGMPAKAVSKALRLVTLLKHRWEGFCFVPQELLAKNRNFPTTKSGFVRMQNAV